jgi:DNA-binding response OmpR family regulator
MVAEDFELLALLLLTGEGLQNASSDPWVDVCSRHMTKTVLVIEDENGIAEPLVCLLELEGYTVVRADAGLPGAERAMAGDVDLVILDLGLPDVDGLEVCRRLRADGYEAGIMILTARGEELDRVVGLDVGADDYVAKPFALAELLARTRALLRRTSRRTSDAPVTIATPAGGLRIDRGSRRVWVDKTEIALTFKEFGVLAMLIQDSGSVVGREQLMHDVWDSNWYGTTKVLDVTIGRLRHKLTQSGCSSVVATVRGVGYRMEDLAPQA